jgi:hypothetical protein
VKGFDLSIELLENSMLRRTGYFYIFLAFMLVACTTKTPAPPVIKDQCLLGTWNVKDREAYARATLPPGSFDQRALTFQKSQGALGLLFKDNGKLYMQALGWTASFEVATDQGILPLVLTMNGSIAAPISLQGNTITVGAIETSEIQFVAKMDKDEMMNTRIAGNFAPFFKQPYNSLQYTCAGDILNLSILNQPGVDTPIAFKRAK